MNEIEKKHDFSLFFRYLETNKPIPLPNEDDPFWDPVEPILLGIGYLKLMSLAYLVDNQTEINIMSLDGSIGQLTTEIIPTDVLGIKNLAEITNIEDNIDGVIDDPHVLIGKRIDFFIKIDNASFPGSLYKDVFVEYELKDINGVNTYKTNTVYGTKYNPRFRYSFHHHYEKIDESLLDYLLNHEIPLKVFNFSSKTMNFKNF